MAGWFWLIVGFLSSAITLHIATLLLLDEASLIKAIAVSASVWLTGIVFVLLHVGGILLHSVVGLIIGCAVLKRLYDVGLAHALVVLLVHGVVELVIGLLLWFTFPKLAARADRWAAAAGSAPGCHLRTSRVWSSEEGGTPWPRSNRFRMGIARSRRS